jgi:hypothetical protein
MRGVARDSEDIPCAEHMRGPLDDELELPVEHVYHLLMCV